MTKHRRIAYYIDEDVIIQGYKDKYGFHPNYGIQCGFNLQKITRKDIGKVLFYDKEKAEIVLNGILEYKNGK